MFRKISLGSAGLLVGGILTIVGFIAYATDNATLNLAGFFYGIPLLLGGLALKASELKPVPFSVESSPEILNLRETQATSTQKQIISDVTRYRYGQEAHLDEVLGKLGLSPTDEERPVLVSLKESIIDGNYALILQFDSPLISFDIWQEKQEKLTKFFGPSIKAEVTRNDDEEIDLALIVVK
jgi:hypothetical protein